MQIRGHSKRACSRSGRQSSTKKALHCTRPSGDLSNHPSAHPLSHLANDGAQADDRVEDAGVWLNDAAITQDGALNI